jgi:hypothetical protein
VGGCRRDVREFAGLERGAGTDERDEMWGVDPTPAVLWVSLWATLAASALAGLLRTVASPTAAFVYFAGWMPLALIGLALPVRTA